MTDNKQKKDQPYQGFEQGPIRPPSEAYSLLIRVTRNCPWNRCAFCPVYKGANFSLRPVEHVIADIDAEGNTMSTCPAVGKTDGAQPRFLSSFDRSCRAMTSSSSSESGPVK